jgi:hypothetical protein
LNCLPDPSGKRIQTIIFNAVLGDRAIQLKIKANVQDSVNAIGGANPQGRGVQ